MMAAVKHVDPFLQGRAESAEPNRGGVSRLPNLLRQALRACQLPPAGEYHLRDCIP